MLYYVMLSVHDFIIVIYGYDINDAKLTEDVDIM